MYYEPRPVVHPTRIEAAISTRNHVLYDGVVLHRLKIRSELSQTLGRRRLAPDPGLNFTLRSLWIGIAEIYNVDSNLEVIPGFCILRRTHGSSMGKSELALARLRAYADHHPEDMIAMCAFDRDWYELFI